MRMNSVYVTQDGISHPTQEKATDHALERAHRLLTDLLKGFSPPEIALHMHKVSAEIVAKLHEEGKEQELADIWSALMDARPPEDDDEEEQA